MSRILSRNPQVGPSSTTGNDDNFNNGSDPWVYIAIKWAVLVAIFVVFLALFVGGYMHARRRMQRGQPLLPYHRWLISRSVRARYESANNPGRPVVGGYGNGRDWPGQQGGTAMPMHPYGGAPPAYNPEQDYVPPYAPPGPGFTNYSTKTNPDQRGADTAVHEREFAGPSSQYQASLGSPPDHRFGTGDLGEGLRK